MANITKIYKNKGSRQGMNNNRGIFILSVLRKILDQLIYNDKYPSIEKNVSDFNIGARKGKSIKNHLFVIYGIINAVINGNADCIDLQV